MQTFAVFIEEVILLHEFGLGLIEIGFVFIPHYNDSNNRKYFKMKKDKKWGKIFLKGIEIRS